MNKPEPELLDREIPNEDLTLALTLARAEIDGQIATARAFPRSVTDFLREATELVTLTEDMAASCIYSLPRDGKVVAGPSARFAEMIQNSYGNNRAGGRVIGEEGNFIVAQGVYHDLQKNTMVTMEVKRRITDKNGRKFKDDMVGVTGNAAASIAHRNAVLKGIPKPIWLPVYEAARRVAIGDITTLVDRRDRALGRFMQIGVTPDMICAKLKIKGVADIGLEELEILTGLKTAIQEGARPEELFAEDKPETSAKVAAFADRVTAKKKPQTEEVKVDGEPSIVVVPTHTAKELRGLLHLAETLEQIAALESAIAAIPDDDERRELEVLRDSRTLAVKP